MPICQVCGIKYSTWHSFDRHLRRGVCHTLHQRFSTSGCTTNALSPSATNTSGTQQASTAPMLQNQSLISSLRVDWVDALDSQCGLKNMLSHHCVVCHQWFEKGWNSTWQHVRSIMGYSWNGALDVSPTSATIVTQHSRLEQNISA